MPETVDAAKLLRAGVLDGLGVLIAGGGSDAGEDVADGAGADSRDDGRDSCQSFAALAGAACAALGARVTKLSADIDAERELAAPDGVDVLIVDAASLFDAGGRAGLRACLDGAWEASHNVANAAFIQVQRPGRIVYVAPPCSRAAAVEDGLADAARAGLENLARTLSIEWARYAITTATIAPGVSTPGEQVAALCAYLASPAGAYFSGCLLDLRGTGALAGR
jgi:NAD(P)-dependent dehydrogenase (short-subunit alcohol dehydrogenase family)